MLAAAAPGKTVSTAVSDSRFTHGAITRLCILYSRTMSSTPLVWLRRSFDVTCAVLGLMLLVLLGPWMLCHAINSPTPQIEQLVRAIMFVTGFAGTAALLCITWVLATRRGAIRSLLTGEHF